MRPRRADCKVECSRCRPRAVDRNEDASKGRRLFLEIADDEDRAFASPHHVFRKASKEQAMQPAPPVTSDDDELRIALLGELEKLFDWVSVEGKLLALDVFFCREVGCSSQDDAHLVLDAAQDRCSVIAVGLCTVIQLNRVDNVTKDDARARLPGCKIDGDLGRGFGRP